MAARQPFWKWHRWKSIGFCLWPPSTCRWNLKLKFQSKLDLCSGNHVVYRQMDGREGESSIPPPPTSLGGGVIIIQAPLSVFLLLALLIRSIDYLTNLLIMQIGSIQYSSNCWYSPGLSLRNSSVLFSKSTGIVLMLSLLVFCSTVI